MSYPQYRSALATAPAEGRGAVVAEWLRRSDDPQILQHACAMAQTLFRAGDIDGYLEIVGGFLDAHPRAKEPNSRQTWLAILGRYPYHGRNPSDGKLAARYVTWIRDRLIAGDHPALFLTLSEFLGAIAGSGDVLSECLRLLEDARYPDERRDAIREIHRKAIHPLLVSTREPAKREAIAKRALLWHPELVDGQRALVSALVEGGRHTDAVALGTSWLKGHETDLGLLRWTILALDGAGHSPEAIELFLVYGPGVTGDWEFPALLQDVLQQYRRSGRDHDAIRDLEPFFEPLRTPDIATSVAALHARNGLADRALHYIRLAVETFGRLPEFNREAFRSADFESLRGTAEYERLLMPPPPVTWDEDDEQD